MTTTPKTKTLRFMRRGELVEITVSWDVWLTLREKVGKPEATPRKVHTAPARRPGQRAAVG